MTGEVPLRGSPRNSAQVTEPYALTLFRAWWRLIGSLAVVGLILGAAIGLLLPRKYASAATFIPESSEGNMSALALAASEFGIRVPTNSGTWGPPVFVELLRSRALLEPIVLDSVTVDGGTVAVTDLLDVRDRSTPVRVERAIIKLRKLLSVSEDKRLNAVRVAVTTRWPEVSLELAERLVEAVSQFNLESRKSQAGAERVFVEAQAAEAKEALRAAENDLQDFLQRNRAGIDSPNLQFLLDRLQREVNLRQSIYTSLVESREEAKIREIRDTPVITVIETPRMSATGEPRRIAMKSVLGAALAGMLGIGLAYLADTLRTGRSEVREAERAT